MYISNIISAGRMMAIVLMLFGIVHCAATFTPHMQEGLSPLVPEILSKVVFYYFITGAILFVAGLLLVVMLRRVDRYPILGTPILITGSFTFIYGILNVAFIYKNPLSWMMAILGLAMFIDALCLKLSLQKKR